MTAPLSGDGAYEELCSLVSRGPRFHGTPGETAAAELLSRRLIQLGATVTTQEVTTIAWRTGAQPQLLMTSPIERTIECWPMMWSAGSNGLINGSVSAQGKLGVWANSFVWHKFAVRSGDKTVAYISARADGPAAPQPLPSGSAASVPHVAIGHADGVNLSNWIQDGERVEVCLSVDAEQGEESTGHNLHIAIDGRDSTSGCAIVCGHYDTLWNTVGAYDNASGVVALLELARRWSTRPPLRPVRLVFFAAEEWHLAGSRTFAAKMSREDLDETAFVINLDGLGRGDLLECSIGPETFEQSATAEIRSFAASSNRPNLELSSRFPPLMGTDHAPFYAAGIPSMHLTFNDWNLLHRPEDIPKRASAQNIAWVVPLVDRLVETMNPVERAPYHDIL